MADIVDGTAQAPKKNPDDDEVSNNKEDTAEVHLVLHSFMTSLLNEAAVSALHTFLIQDNASILSKSASRSAHAAHRRFLLGRDHLITKEISRWESYPFEVDKPLVLSRPKKGKNGGCVPQRRAKRRSGLESAGEIKADILKKAESLPRPPRRRSSVRADDPTKATMQAQLLASFDEAKNNKSNTSTNAINSRINERPRRTLSPHRIATPKKPVRRASEVPDDLTTISHTAPNVRSSIGSMGNSDSQHSTASSETTLSELTPRQSDLSSISEYSDWVATMESRSLDCSVILEEDEDQGEGTSDNLFPLPPPAPLKPNNSSQMIPRKPMRRVSELPEDCQDSLINTDSRPIGDQGSGAIEVKQPEREMQRPDHLPPLDRIKSAELDEVVDDSMESGSSERRVVRKANSMPSKVSSNPRKPIRRPSDVPSDIIHGMNRPSLEKYDDDEAHSLRVETTVSGDCASLEKLITLCDTIKEESYGVGLYDESDEQ